MAKQNLRIQKHQSAPSQKPINEYVKYSGLAFQMAALLLLGYWAGSKIDQWLNLAFPVFTIVLMVLFMIISLYSLIKSLPKD
jgi:ATP synthase protein I